MTTHDNLLNMLLIVQAILQRMDLLCLNLDYYIVLYVFLKYLLYYSSGDRTITGRYSCSLIVKGFGKFKGTGRSLRIARSTAAQRALAHIQAKKESAELKLEQQ